jgi:hypothetical protein
MAPSLRTTPPDAALAVSALEDELLARSASEMLGIDVVAPLAGSLLNCTQHNFGVAVGNVAEQAIAAELVACGRDRHGDGATLIGNGAKLGCGTRGINVSFVECCRREHRQWRQCRKGDHEWDGLHRIALVIGF